jgi:polysaccharide biosynthesis protein PslA
MTKLDAKLSPDKYVQRSIDDAAGSGGYFLATARDKRTFLYLLSLLLDILSLVAGYLVALQWRDDLHRAADLHHVRNCPRGAG